MASLTQVLDEKQAVEMVARIACSNLVVRFVTALNVGEKSMTEWALR